MTRKTSSKTNNRKHYRKKTTQPLITKASDFVNHNGVDVCQTARENIPSAVPRSDKENAASRYASTNIVQDDLIVLSGTEPHKHTITPAPRRPSWPRSHTRGAPGKLHADCSTEEQLTLFSANGGYRKSYANTGCLACDNMLAGLVETLKTGSRDDVERYVKDLLTQEHETPVSPVRTRSQDQEADERATPRLPARPNTTRASPSSATSNSYRDYFTTQQPPLDPRSPPSRAHPSHSAGPSPTPPQGQPSEDQAKRLSVVVDPPTYHTPAMKRPLDLEHEVQPRRHQAEIRTRRAWSPRREGWREEKW